MHLSLQQATASPPAGTGPAQQRRFDGFGKEFNEDRPHEALGLATPASVYQPSGRAYPAREPRVTYPADWLTRMLRVRGEVKFKGPLFLSTALIGEPVGLEPIDGRHWRVHFGPVALGVFDEHRHRLPAPRELKHAGLTVVAPARNPPVAALQEACGPGEEVLPMSLD